jgi:hypothetical protein
MAQANDGHAIQAASALAAASRPWSRRCGGRPGCSTGRTTRRRTPPGRRRDVATSADLDQACALTARGCSRACEQVPVRARSAFSGQLHGRYGLGVAARATPTPDTCRRSRGGSRARRGAAELSLIYADRRRVVQAVPASPGVRSPLEQFLERLLVLAQLLGCLPAYDEREERLSDSMRLEDRQDPLHQ